jgi:hypothetical protein
MEAGGKRYNFMFSSLRMGNERMDNDKDESESFETNSALEAAGKRYNFMC